MLEEIAEIFDGQEAAPPAHHQLQEERDLKESAKHVEEANGRGSDA
jgi:hypothetical protein